MIVRENPSLWPANLILIFKKIKPQTMCNTTAKRRSDEVDDRDGKVPRLDTSTTADRLRFVINNLIDQRNKAEFPAICLEVVHDVIAPILNEGNKDGFIFAQQTTEGKTLVAVLALAAMVASQGLNDVQEQRAKSDVGRQFGSKDWVSWAKTKPSKEIRTTKWSNIKPYFETEPQQPQVIEDDQLDQSIVDCFQQHDVMSCCSTDVFGDCAICGAAYENSNLQFYRCIECDIDLCATCEARRYNYQ